MNPFKALAERYKEGGIAGLLGGTPVTGPPSNRPVSRRRTSLMNLHPDNIDQPPSYDIQPDQPWPRDDGPIPEGYEDPSISRQATSTLGIPYPTSYSFDANGNVILVDAREEIHSNIAREAYRQTAIQHYIEEGLAPEAAAITAAERVNERFGTLSDHQAQRDAYEALHTGPPMPPVPPARTVGLGSVTRSHPPLYHSEYSSGTPMSIQPQEPQGDTMALSHFPGVATTIQPSTRSCKGCAHCITDNIYCEACTISPRDYGEERPLGALPIIDRFISKENVGHLYNEWKEKAIEKLRKQVRQEILDEMKEDKKVYKKAMLGNIVKHASKTKMLIAG